MKSFKILFLLTFVSVFVSMMAQAQAPTGRYEVRLVHGAYNCAKDSVVVCVEIRATSADSAFVMGNANFLLIYPTNKLSQPIFRNRGVFSGGDYSNLGITRTAGTPTSALSINVVNNGVNGAGKLVDANWQTVACLAFSTLGNTDKYYDLTISATNPTTVVTMAVPNNTNGDPTNDPSLTREVSQGALSSITNQGPANPTVTLSGGGVINSGASTNLTVSSQNSVLPVTVVLSSNGGTVTLTTQEPSKSVSVSPTQDTIYSIQSVTGECGVGTGTGTASVAITGGPIGCNVKCVPVSLLVIK